MHADEGQVQAFLHGQLVPAAAETMEDHLSRCADCRQRVEEARHQERQICGLLEHLDHPAPAVNPEHLVGRARGRQSMVLARAAGFLIALGVAAGSYAIPDSPVRRWIDRGIHWIAQPQHATNTEAATSGIKVPVSGRFTVRFLASQERGEARIAVTDGAGLVVRAMRGRAVLTTGAEELVIENAGSRADYLVELPRSAAWIEIRVGERRVALREGTRWSEGADFRGDGPWVLPLSASSRSAE